MATQIQSDLFLGNLGDARTWEGFVLDVQETRDPRLPANVIQLPVYDPVSGRALFGQLEAMLHVLDDAAGWGETPILISCQDGFERAPLALAWYLYRRRRMSMTGAYRLIKGRRPGTIEHFGWLFGPGFWKWW